MSNVEYSKSATPADSTPNIWHISGKWSKMDTKENQIPGVWSTAIQPFYIGKIKFQMQNQIDYGKMHQYIKPIRNYPLTTPVTNEYR